MTFFNIIDNCLKLTLDGLINQVGSIISNNRLVCRNRDNIHIVYVSKLFFLRFCCPGHACQLIIHSEKVLKCNRSEERRVGKEGKVPPAAEPEAQTEGRWRGRC